MASEATSSLQLVAEPKELLLVLSILNEKQKAKHKQQQQQQLQHLHHYYQQQHKQQELGKNKGIEEPKQLLQHMELSQIELIYRAEGNANLVLALPQFGKVLRLPKIYKRHEQKQLKQKAQNKEIQLYQEHSQQHEQPQGQLSQKYEMSQQETNKIFNIGEQESKEDAVGILTMDHYVAYISIIRCLVGNELVFEADIVAVPNPTDRDWINEHIKPHRPANRLDKEFGGHFGLLLPDATQLPAQFDILFSNLQSPKATTDTKTLKCCSSNSTDDNRSISNNIFGSDTFAIEIKPKQGWLLPNDVNNLFDIKPKITQNITRTTQPPSLRETKTTLKAPVVTTISTAKVKAKALKTPTDIGCFTSTQNEPSSTIMPVLTRIPTTTITTTATATAQTIVAMTSRCCSATMNTTNKEPRDDKTSHLLYDKVDTRCRYCCMQFLKVKQKKIVKRNQYCPIDLFSGNYEKMCFALQSLFECPQNNLRIFQNGKLLFDDQISRTSKIEDLFSSDKLQLIKHLLVKCLLREYDNKREAKNKGKETHEQLVSNTASIPDARGVKNSDGRDGGGTNAGVAVGQPQSSATLSKKQKLSTMPRTIAAATTSMVETEVTKVKSTLTLAEPIFSMDNALISTSDYSTQCLEQINKTEMTCLPKNCVLQKILHLQSLAKINLQFMADHEYADKKEKTYNIVCNLLEKYSKIRNDLTTLCQLSPEEQYIIGATALDCSIMITFSEIPNVLEDEEEKAMKSLIDNTFVVSIFGKTFLTKVTLLDLDPKPDSHFYKYSLQTKEILDAINEQ